MCTQFPVVNEERGTKGAYVVDENDDPKSNHTGVGDDVLTGLVDGDGNDGEVTL